MNPEDMHITISLEADIDMKVGDLWPDDDYPEDITAEAIRDLMESSGPYKWRVLHDWSLDEELDVTVVVDKPNPAYRQDENLLGDAPLPRRLHLVAKVWDA